MKLPLSRIGRPTTGAAADTTTEERHIGKLAAQEWEVGAALILSELVFKDDHGLRNTLDQKYSLVGKICRFQCPLGQRYLIAVIEHQRQRVLFCSFAGTNQSSDWLTNFDVRLNTVAEEFGAPAHAGFVKRANETAITGIARLVRSTASERVIFCGHSLGGAVSHLCAVRALYSGMDSFRPTKLVSIGFGAPFFAGDAMHDHIKRSGYQECFITFVNGRDPVPRVLNLIESVEGFAIGGLVQAASRLLVTSIPNKAMQHASRAALDLYSGIAANSKKEKLYTYVPIGRYVVMREEAKILYPNEVVEALGRPELFSKSDSFLGKLIEGVLDQGAISDHCTKQYRNACFRFRDVISEHCGGVPPSVAGEDYVLAEQELELTKVFELDSASLVPKIQSIECEIVVSPDSDTELHRVLFIRGNNLDFVSENCIQFDKSQVDGDWSMNPLTDAGKTIVRQDIDKVVILETLAREKMPFTSEDKFRGIPNSSLSVNLLSHVTDTSECPFAIVGKLERDHCSFPYQYTSHDPLSFYGGQFFLDAQQHAWIVNKLFGDLAAKREFERLREFITASIGSVIDKRSLDLITNVSEWETLDELSSKAGGMVGSSLRKHLFEWAVPSQGLTLRTQAQQAWGYGSIVTGVVIGGGIIAAGGLGIVGAALGLEGSATGGFGWAAIAGSSGMMANSFLHSRLQSNYRLLLDDLVSLYGQKALVSDSEMDVERELLDLASEKKESRVDDLIASDRAKVESLIQFVRHVHNLKQERMKYKMIAVCGTRDAGKTTLVSQLLQNPELALHAGIQGQQEETRQVTPFKLASLEKFAILDTPGLTAPEEEIRAKFESEALRLSSGYVYIRNYHGLAEESDVKALASILSCASRSTRVPVLICLNRAESALTRDAVGERFDLIASEQKKKWKQSLDKRLTGLGPSSWLRHILTGPNCRVEFVDLSGDKNLEEKLHHDGRLRGTWTAHSIGDWIAKAVEAEESTPGLARHFSNFNYQAWQSGVIHERKRQREEALRETESPFMCGAFY